jgi:hypothetical protein
MMNCFECESEEDIHMHHVIPRSLGGTKTVPLCNTCHAKIHGSHLLGVSNLSGQALKNKKSKNLRWCKNAPYGYRWEKEDLVADKDEMAIIDRIFFLSESAMSSLGIAKILTEEGKYSRTGKTFSHMTVRRILSNKNYKVNND